MRLAGAVDAMVRRALTEMETLDVLVCNAAIRPHQALTETSLEEWHRVLAVNLHSAFYLTRAVVPAMKARQRGSIIAIGGQSSVTGRPNTAAVTAAKTGLLGLVRALAGRRTSPRPACSWPPTPPRTSPRRPARDGRTRDRLTTRAPFRQAD